MTDSVLDVLKLVLLALLYLFFGRVLWAVWSEVRPARAAKAGAPQGRSAPESPTTAADRPAPVPASGKRKPHKGRGGRAARLVILEPRERRGVTFAIQGELTIGRDDHCTITLTGDTFVSGMHARVFDLDGQPMIEDLDSTNGSFHNGNKLRGARLLHPGDRIQIGATLMEAQ